MSSQNAIEFGSKWKRIWKFWDTEHATGTARIDINALPASYWVNTTPGCTVSTDVEASRTRSLRFHDRAVQSCETLESINVCDLYNVPSSATYPELQRVSPPYSGPVVTFKRRGTRWLDLSRFLGDEGRCVLMKGSKLSSNVKLLVDAELLVSDDCKGCIGRARHKSLLSAPPHRPRLLACMKHKSRCKTRASKAVRVHSKTFSHSNASQARPWTKSREQVNLDLEVNLGQTSDNDRSHSEITGPARLFTATSMIYLRSCVMHKIVISMSLYDQSSAVRYITIIPDDIAK
ncbi:hypothetical protein EDD22DRAFT_852591 [Suillus occidentalis]|nr:hypothetical protein EDD22DRAFT_852591 [Suillus occidentalis]